MRHMWAIGNRAWSMRDFSRGQWSRPKVWQSWCPCATKIIRKTDLSSLSRISTKRSIMCPNKRRHPLNCPKWWRWPTRTNNIIHIHSRSSSIKWESRRRWGSALERRLPKKIWICLRPRAKSLDSLGRSLAIRRRTRERLSSCWART